MPPIHQNKLFYVMGRRHGFSNELLVDRTIPFALAARIVTGKRPALRRVCYVMDSSAVLAAARLFRFMVIGEAAVWHLLFYRTIIFTITIRIATRIRSAFWRGLTMMNGFTVVTTARLH
jgi:hypothetical protein